MTNQQNEKRLILVTGATGKQGGAVASHLLNQGFSVRALVRDPSKSAALALADRGTQLVVGDLNDRTSIDQALQGVEGVFSVQTYNADRIEIEIEQGITLADAAKAASVNHFVYASVGSANRHTGVPHFESKWQIEQHIRAIALPYTILRPTFYMHNWDGYRETIQNGTLPQPLSPDTKLQQFGVDDIGAFATMAFANPKQWIGREVDLAGDERTMQEVAQTFSQVINRPVNYVQISWEQFEQDAGKERTTMYRWLQNIGYAADIAALHQEYPQLTTLKQDLLNHDWGLI